MMMILGVPAPLLFGQLLLGLINGSFYALLSLGLAVIFGLLVELDLDFVATSERLWGTHDTVPQLAITEVIRDADLETIVLEHSRWDGRRRESASCRSPTRPRLDRSGACRMRRL